ncbi:dihydroxy-acid dehydratase [Candidatus Pelagibacter sp. HIMB109]|uniref:dihydroxy-acid dehydratase n=1 Tax=Candidatus Pelagibacter sp. HIMB109 TaxID=3415412 RepID=UPI003F8574C3
MAKKIKDQGIDKSLTNYGDKEFSSYLRRSFARSMGYTTESLNKPIVGIVNTASGLNSCHRHFPEMIEALKRGIQSQNCLGVDFPVISLGEVYLSPTSMMFRNLMSMDVEEMIRAQPVDVVVLLGGCDKTLPAMIMGAISAGKPYVVMPAGPMITNKYENERLGACTDCRRYWGKYRGGEISDQKIKEVEGKLAASSGTCAVMGTASTVACLVETMGLCLPDASSVPAVYSERLKLAEQTGEVAAKIANKKIKKIKKINEKDIYNALVVLLALGGSTNAIVHLTAIAGRAGINIDLKKFNQISNKTPVLVNLKPTGSYYMEDFYHAGGMKVVLKELQSLLKKETFTIEGKKLSSVIKENSNCFHDQEVIRSKKKPFEKQGGLVSLFGNICPKGAILKRSAADKKLFEKTGMAFVFEDIKEMTKKIDDPKLKITKDDILVLKNIGPKTIYGMPEAGYLPIPKKILKSGVKDMIRISDGRMSGTAFGTIILHVSPESAVGGPFSILKTGDKIKLSVKNKSLNVLLSKKELEKRLKNTKIKAPIIKRGYLKLYYDTVLQADEGCDFDFLKYKK